jgi:formyltetrahydrofolate synthetase
MMFPNAARGETTLMVDGRPRRLCVTLGAMAALESAFGAESIVEVAARLAAPSSRDLMAVVKVLAAHGGDSPDAVEFEKLDIDPTEAARAVAAAFALAFSDDAR